VVLLGRELNWGCWDRIPASYHLTTLTPTFVMKDVEIVQRQNSMFLPTPQDLKKNNLKIFS